MTTPSCSATRNVSLGKTIVSSLLIGAAVTFGSGCSSKSTQSDTQYTRSKVAYDSNQLMMMNADQVAELVRKRIKRAQDIQSRQEIDDDVGIRTEPEAVEALRDALRITLSRPDQDGSRANLFANVRRELTDLNAFDETLQAVAHEAIGSLKSSGTPVRVQATSVVILENMMAELHPEMGTNMGFKKIIEEVRDARIEISDKLKNQALMNSMNRPTSPSETAAKILPKKK